MEVDDLSDSQCSAKAGRCSSEDGVDMALIGADEQPTLHVSNRREGLSRSLL